MVEAFLLACTGGGGGEHDTDRRESDDADLDVERRARRARPMGLRRIWMVADMVRAVNGGQSRRYGIREGSIGWLRCGDP